jgi:hypothetical protein
VDVSEHDDERQSESKYAHLPEPVRYEDLRTSQDVVQPDDPLGEADRERDWLLRTAGVL